MHLLYSLALSPVVCLFKLSFVSLCKITCVSRCWNQIWCGLIRFLLRIRKQDLSFIIVYLRGNCPRFLVRILLYWHVYWKLNSSYFCLCRNTWLFQIVKSRRNVSYKSITFGLLWFTGKCQKSLYSWRISPSLLTPVRILLPSVFV